MNFTREPIIETIISPKEGYKLLVRNSKGENFEEHYVDAVEVVSFGRAFFFRSMERPKAFLVPVSDYEILEIKEARVALKNASHEKSIKIGGGREAPVRPVQKEQPPSPVEGEEPLPSTEETALETAVESRMDRKRDRRRHRRRRGGGHEERPGERTGERTGGEQKQHSEQSFKEEGKEGMPEDEIKSQTLFSTLIPPPPTLISETLSRYREKEAEMGTGESGLKMKEEEQEEKTEEEGPEEEPGEDSGEDSGSDSSTLNRMSATEIEVKGFNANYFVPFSGGSDSFY